MAEAVCVVVEATINYREGFIKLLCHGKVGVIDSGKVRK